MKTGKQGWFGLLLMCAAMVITGDLADAASLQAANDALRTGLSDAADETSRYFVILSDPPVPSYRGGVANLAATQPAISGSAALDPRRPAVLAYAAHLATRQDALEGEVAKTLARAPEIIHRLQYALNAVVMVLSPAEAEIVAGLPGVKRVAPDAVEWIDTDYGPQWIGAPGIWDGSATGSLPGTQGEGVLIGVLDSGINMAHPSFGVTGDDGYTHDNPFGSGNYKGWCDPGNPNWNAAYPCNAKLVGAWDYADASWGEADGPEDNDGHGSHTASTAAGNHLDPGEVTLGDYGYSPAISGVAPHANIIAYDVCGPTGSCYSSDCVAALNQAILDGVDVVNESIGISGNTWTGVKQAAYLSVFDAGITAVRSAGNEGPGAGTVTGTPPWVITAGASTHNRAGLKALTGLSGGDTTAPGSGTLNGLGFSNGYGSAPIVYAGNYGDAPCLNPFGAGTFTGQIVVCDRGINARVAKGWNVLQGGAGGMVLVNTAPGQSLNADVHHLPAVHLDSTDGAALKTWLAGGSGHTGSIAGTTIDTSAANGDIMAAFSSRGPHPVPNLLTPDLTAPGVDILAAFRTGAIGPEDPTTEYAVMSGTSMASPHTAGAAALLKALRPTWSPAEIKSALMDTAKYENIFNEDATGADPFDMGAGRVNLAHAGMAGLILDETTATFAAADPGSGGDPRTLNLASMADATCNGTCAWTRTVRATRGGTWTASYATPAGMTLSVTPDDFSLSEGDTLALEIEADVNAIPLTTYAFGHVVLKEASGGPGSEVHLTVAVRHFEGTPAVSVSPVGLAGTQAPGIVTQKELKIQNTGTADLTWSLHEAAATEPTVAWSDDFDSYAAGSELMGQGGWAGFTDSPDPGAAVSNERNRSAPNSVKLLPATDVVHTFSGHTTGKWVFTAWQYIPAGYTGTSYVILLNTYPAAPNWSTQVNFNGDTNMVNNEGISGGSLPLVRDRWVELRVEIDLDHDFQAFYYDGKLLFQGSWTGEVSGAGAVNIGAVNLFANGAAPVFYDDLQLAESNCCQAFSDIPWLSAAPLSGTITPGGSAPVTVGIDSTGLSAGIYKADLCITTSIAARPLVTVPVELTVVNDLIRVTASPDLPIPDFGNATPGQVVDTISLPYDFSITNLDVCLDIPHETVGDLVVTLRHVETGTTVTLVDQPGLPGYDPTYGCPGSDLDVTVDDEGLDPAIEDQCSLTAPAISGVAPGTSPLSAFDGESSLGNWELTVTDNFSGGTGRLFEWCLEIKTDGALAPAVTLKKTVGTEPGVCSDRSDIQVERGTEVTYCYTLTNDGNTPLSVHTLIDDKLGALLTDAPLLLVAGGRTEVFQNAVMDATTTNTATWTAYEPSGAMIRAAARATVTLLEPAPVPVLNRTGAAVLVLLVIGTGAWAIRRRKRV